MIHKILVPVDGSPVSLRGLEQAIELAKQTQSTVRIIHAVDELLMTDAALGADFYNEWLERMRKRGEQIVLDAQTFARQRGVDAESICVQEIGKRAAQSIVEQAQAWPADVIVMGTHGRRGINRLLMGSDAELVLRNSAVPVLLVRDHVESTWTPN